MVLGSDQTPSGIADECSAFHSNPKKHSPFAGNVQINNLSFIVLHVYFVLLGNKDG
jgi:hypothetical protein